MNASATKHTPTPWALYEHDPLIIVDEKGSSLGEMVPGDPYISRTEALANAALVVAAVNAQARADLDAGLILWLEQQARNSQTGISFDWVPSVEGEPSGWRFMRRHFIGEAKKSLRQAIISAREQIEVEQFRRPRASTR